MIVSLSNIINGKYSEDRDLFLDLVPVYDYKFVSYHKIALISNEDSLDEKIVTLQEIMNYVIKEGRLWEHISFIDESTGKPIESFSWKKNKIVLK